MNDTIRVQLLASKRTASRKVRKKAKNKRVLCLMSSGERYGGPEEGGWYWTMRLIESAQVFASKAAQRRFAHKTRAHIDDTVPAPRPHNGYYEEYLRTFKSMTEAQANERKTSGGYT